MDRLTSIFAEVLDVSAEELSDDTSPDNTPSWDSLAAITLTGMIEEAFSVRLSARDIMRMQTIGLAREVLRSKGATDI